MDTELQLARDIAADQSGYVEHARAAFRAGWDAAIEHVTKQRDNECGFCWVCRTYHRLIAEHCRAMDGVM